MVLDMSEAVAALFGLKVAARFGFDYVQLEGDSLNVVSSIENRVQRLFAYKPPL